MTERALSNSMSCNLPSLK